jgi:Predicted transcriptional regulators
MIADRPRHGYELIKEIESLSSGAYVPSPGTIYPTLTFLEEGGYATATDEAKKKLYTITDLGLSLLAENRQFVEELKRRFAEAGKRRSMFNSWMGKEMDQEVARGDRNPIRRAMHLLKVEMYSLHDSNKEHRDKVAAIIDKAAEEIKKLKK